MDNFLNLDDLYAPHINRDQIKYKFYNEVLSRCHAKIKKTNEQLKKLECEYNIPKFVIGGPLYDLDDLRAYIIYKLEHNGLSVMPLSSEKIHISWKPQDIDRRKYEKNMKKRQEAIERKYNVADSKVVSQTLKHKNNAVDSAITPETEIGILQYNSLYKDMVPINPKKINRFANNPNFPVSKRKDNMNSMLLTEMQKKNLRPGAHLYQLNTSNNSN